MPYFKGSKKGVSPPIFDPFFVLKPLYVVVESSYLPSKPQYVIRIAVSTWLECLLLMSAFTGTYQPLLSVFEVWGTYRLDFYKIMICTLYTIHKLINSSILFFFLDPFFQVHNEMLHDASIILHEWSKE